MTSKRHNFQFRLPEEVEEKIMADAKRRKVSPNEYVRSLVISSMSDIDSATGRSDMMLKIAATMFYRVSFSTIEMLKQINPHLSQKDIDKIAAENIFSPSKEKAADILKSLGVE